MEYFRVLFRLSFSIAHSFVASKRALVVATLFFVSSISFASYNLVELRNPSPKRSRNQSGNEIANSYIQYRKNVLFDFHRLDRAIWSHKKNSIVDRSKELPEGVSEITPIDPASLQSKGPAEYKTTIDKLQLDKIPHWPKEKNHKLFFENARDNRFMKDKGNFSRRITWLYPDDGCFARTELMAQQIEKQGAPAGVKIYAFGSLINESAYSDGGPTEWWYHVAVGYLVDGKVAIFDPSVSPEKIVTLNEWIQKMGNPKDLTLSICHRNSYGPSDSCLNPKSNRADRALEDEFELFPYEWERVSSIGKDPKLILGDSPPWK